MDGENNITNKTRVIIIIIIVTLSNKESEKVILYNTNYSQTITLY